MNNNIRGEQGEKGEQGNRGDRGEKGIQGIPGPPGKSLVVNFCSSFSCIVLLMLIMLSPLLYLAILNSVGPSTEYHNPTIATAVRGPDGRDTVYLGDEFYVNIFVVRHRINGNCKFKIRRYAEPLEGEEQGDRYLLSTAELQFVGQNEMRRARWPSPPDKYILGYAINEQGDPQYDFPLLPEGVDQREFLFYVVGRYYCNVLDYIFPRFIQGGPREDETAHVRAVVKRHKP
jgi:hypothetical protein